MRKLPLGEPKLNMRPSNHFCLAVVLLNFGIASVHAFPRPVLGGSFVLVATNAGTGQVYGLAGDDQGFVYAGNNSGSFPPDAPLSRFRPSNFSGHALPFENFGPVFADSDGLAYGSGFLYVASLNGLFKVSVANASSSTFIPTIGTNLNGSPVVFRPSDGHIFVGQDTAIIYEYDAFGVYITNHPTANNVETMTMDVRTGLIYYAPFPAGVVSSYNPVTRKEAALVSIDGAVDGGLTVDSVSGRLLVGTANGANPGCVFTVDLSTGEADLLGTGFRNCLGILREPISGNLYILGQFGLYQYITTTSTQPIITSQPQGQTVFPGMIVSFSVSVLSATPVTYQWVFNGGDIDGATNGSLFLPRANDAQTGNYGVRVNNALGSTSSSNAVLTVSTNVLPVPAGAVAWWTGDNTPNDRVGTNDGILMVDTSSRAGYSTGVVGRAFSFNGIDEYVAIANSPSLNISGPITVEAWINRTTTGLQNAVLEKYGPSSGGYALRVGANDRVLFYTLDTGYDGSVVSGSTAILSNTWYHIAGLWDGTNLQVYVNGHIDGTVNSTRNPKMGTTGVRIAARGDDGSTPFGGLLDELRVYNRALAPAEIQAIYSAGTNRLSLVLSPMLVAPHISKPSGAFNWDAIVSSGGRYSIQISTNLSRTNWVNLTNFVAGLGPMHYTNSGAISQPQGFYRITSP